MNLPSTRTSKRRAPWRQQLDSQQYFSGRPRHKGPLSEDYKGYSCRAAPPRRSTRLQSKQCSTLTSQNALKHRLAARQTSHTRLITSGPINALVSSRAQLQDQSDTHQIRKRGLDRSAEKSLERPLKRPRLTAKNLKRLENMGKPAGNGSTGQSQKSKSLGSQRKSSDVETKSTRSKQTISTTDSGFQDAVFGNGVADPFNSRPPANLTSFQDRLNRTRDTVSPTEIEFESYEQKIQISQTESTVFYHTSKLLKEYNEPGYNKSFNQAFNTFPKNVGLNNGLSSAQPDMVEGLIVPEYNPFPIRKQLGGAAVFTSGPNATTLPHLAGEWKGPGKDMIKAQTQAAYDGACMVYGRNQARSFLGNPDPNNHAYVHSFTTDGTILNTFAHYSSQSRGQVKYHQYPTSTSLLRSSHADFNTARRRLRNLQDIVKESSETLRDELRNKWASNQQQAEDEDDDDNTDASILPPMAQDIQAKPADRQNYDSYGYDDQEDEEDGAGSQLLSEYYASFAKDGDGEEDKDEDENEEEDFVQIPTPKASSSASKPRSRQKKKKRSR